MYKNKSNILIVIIVACFSLLVISCGERKEPVKNKLPYPVEVKNITLYRMPERIVSLSDEVTSVLLDLELADSIVGIDDSSELEAVSALPRAGISGQPDLEVLQNLEPDLVITTAPLSTFDMDAISAQNAKVLVLSEDDNYRALLTRMKGNQSEEGGGSDSQ